MPLENKLTGRVARFADRREDWSVFGFETARDPRYARAQRRYLGASGSADPKDLRGAIPATAFRSVRFTSQTGQGVAQYFHRRCRRRGRGHEGYRRACWSPREDTNMLCRFGAVTTPEGVGDVVDRGRIGFAARDAIEILRMTAGFNDLREEGTAIGDVCQRAAAGSSPSENDGC